MTVILASDAGIRRSAAPTPLEWDVSFTRVDPTSWDVTIHLAAERDPYGTTPDPVIATGSVRADATGDTHHFNIWGSETVAWPGGDDTMLTMAHRIIDEVSR